MTSRVHLLPSHPLKAEERERERGHDEGIARIKAKRFLDIKIYKDCTIIIIIIIWRLALA